MRERPVPRVKLDRNGSTVCVACGEEDLKANLNLDHGLPLCLLGTQKDRNSLWRSGRIHLMPFQGIVNNYDNLHWMHEGEHAEIDRKKCREFLKDPSPHGFKRSYSLDRKNRGNPVGLMLYLMDEYPIPKCGAAFYEETRKWRAINRSFIRIAYTLNGGMSEELRTRYQEAARVANAFNRKLTFLRPQQPVKTIDFGRQARYNPDNQTSNT